MVKNKLELLHEENLRLIKEYNLKVGDCLKLVDVDKIRRPTLPLNNVKNGDIFTISAINKFWGWICFKESEQLPQDVKSILSGFELMKGGNLKR